MKVKPLIIMSAFQLSIAAGLAVFAWYNLASVYWRKDLELPVNAVVWLFISFSICVLTFGSLLALLSRIFSARKLQPFFVASISGGVGMPLVNVFTAKSFTALGGDSSIYFLSNNGLQILTIDSVILLITGLLAGTLCALLAIIVASMVNRIQLP
jgi:hypothetical protein